MIKNIYYKVADILSGGKGKDVTISGVNLKLPIKYHKYYESNYEEESIGEMKKLISKGQVVVDVGAQLGLMSKLFSDCVGSQGKVFSFEPTPSTYEILKETISINNLMNVELVKKAVADKSGQTTFNISSVDASAANSLAEGGVHGNDIPIKVDLVSIDDFYNQKKLDKIDFIKIDAEGAEFAVLKGAKSVIDNCEPTILLALHPSMILNFGDSMSDIYDYCKDCNYKVIYEGKELGKFEFINRKDLFDVFLTK